MQVKRFGVSLEEELLDSPDRLVADKYFPNRSQAIRFMIKKIEVEERWIEDMEVAGALVLIYDHHRQGESKQTPETCR